MPYVQVHAAFDGLVHILLGPEYSAWQRFSLCQKGGDGRRECTPRAVQIGGVYLLAAVAV